MTDTFPPTPPPPMPEPHPLVGTTVLYFHPLDWQYWPAVVLDVTGGQVMGFQPTETIIVDGEKKVVSVPPPPTEELYYLQVLRPRGNDWVRVTKGDGVGQWKFAE